MGAGHGVGCQVMTTCLEQVGQLHHRMPLILARESYERWPSQEPDPHDLMTRHLPSRVN